MKQRIKSLLSKSNTVQFYGISAALIWMFIIIFSLTWNMKREHEIMQKLALREARATLNKDEVLRLWVGSHGGVYAFVGDGISPNPNLSYIPERDIKTPSGKLLTLMNAAFLLRKIMDDFSEKYGIRGRIASFKPLRPENSPDEWEKKALLSFEKGSSEIFEFSEIFEKPYLRLMRPMVTKKECLKCHGFQGYKVGDILGGVGLSIPMSSYLKLEKDRINILYISHGLILILGFAGIGFGTKKVGRDMLKRQLAEKALLKTNKILENVFSSNTLLIAYLDSKFNFIRVNKAYAETDGRVPEFYLGKNLFDLLPSEENQTIFRQVVETGNSYSTIAKPFGYKNHSKCCGTYWDWSLLPIKDLHGKVEALVLTLVNVTERKRAEEKLKDYRDHLEKMVKDRTAELESAQEELIKKERLAVLGKLTATVSHEIRNPLGTIRSALFYIGEVIEQNQIDLLADTLKQAERNITRCDRIIDELLSFTRIPKLKLEVTDIDNCLTNILKEHALPENIEYTSKIDSGAQVFIDQEHFRRAIINVLDNAIQALEDKKSHVNQLRVETEVVNNKLEIRIIDTGIGIPDDQQEKVFEPLLSTKIFGVGLGMPIVKDIMEKHGGGIELHSKEGKGTTVVLWVPLSDRKK